MRVLLFNLATDLDEPCLAFTVHWIRKLAGYVEHIDVITMRMGRFELPENVNVYSVGKERGYSEARRCVEFYRILFRLVRSHRYDGCFAHMMPIFAVLGAPLLRWKHIPSVLWYTHKSVTWVLRLATFLVDRVVTASNESFRLASEKVRVIGHGIDTTQFIPVKRQQDKHQVFTIVSVGRLSPIKRLEVLLEAVAVLLQTHQQTVVRVKLVGGPLVESDNEYVETLHALVENSQLKESVDFEGEVSFGEIPSVYQQADCCINLCPTGGMDKAVLEAMSCGVPVIVANETFRKVLGGALAQEWVVEADAEQLAERIFQLIVMSKEERSALGMLLREITIKDYDLKDTLGRILEVFQMNS